MEEEEGAQAGGMRVLVSKDNRVPERNQQMRLERRETRREGMEFERTREISEKGGEMKMGDYEREKIMNLLSCGTWTCSL